MKSTFSSIITKAATMIMSIIPMHAIASVPPGDDSVVLKVISLAADHNRTMEHLDVLTNRFGGRPLGSDAYTHAPTGPHTCSANGVLKSIRNMPGKSPSGSPADHGPDVW